MQELAVASGKINMIAAIWATNKQALVDYIRAMGCSEFLVQHPGAPLLQITLEAGCGGQVSYKTEEEIPEQSVPCPCGNSEHWLIKYDR